MVYEIRLFDTLDDNELLFTWFRHFRQCRPVKNNKNEKDPASTPYLTYSVGWYHVIFPSI